MIKLKRYLIWGIPLILICISYCVGYLIGLIAKLLTALSWLLMGHIYAAESDLVDFFKD